MVQIFSATRGTIWHDAWWKQIIFIAGGLLLMWLVTFIDYHALLHHVTWMYVLSVVGLLGTLLIGRQAFGSRRWIPLAGGFHFQVSEFVKLVIILLVARFLTDLKSDVLEARDMLKISGLVGIPMILVLKQPDLGTALTYLPALVVGMFLAGLRWKYMLAIVVVVVLVLPVGWHFLKDYQKARLISFMDPDRDPRGTGYQMIQSKIAVGAGGMWGKGVTKGSADAASVPAGAAYGFHLFRLCGRAWIRRRGGCVGVVFYVGHADRAERPDRSGSGRYVYLHGCSRDSVVSRAGERRDGGGTDARDRHSSAADERRRVQCFIQFFDAGAGEQCPPQTFCELNGCGQAWYEPD